MQFREATPYDLQSILDLSLGFTTSPFASDPRYLAKAKVYTPVFAREMVRSPRSRTILAIDNSETVGFITFGPNPALSSASGISIGNILLLAVAEHRRGRGLGREMASMALSELVSQGVKLVMVGTDQENNPAKKLYEGLGFKKRFSWGIFRDYRRAQDVKTSTGRFRPLSLAELDGFENHLERPVSLFKEKDIHAHAVRAFIWDALRRSVMKNSSLALGWEDGQELKGALILARDRIAEETLGLAEPIFRVSDIWPVMGVEQKETIKAMLNGIRHMFPSAALFECWAGIEQEWLMASLLSAGYENVYTGVTYHYRTGQNG